MRLVDLDPRFVASGGDGITSKDGSPVPRREGIGLCCNCPKCGEDHPMFVPFKNPLDGGPPTQPERPSWERAGDNFETMTLSPSILRNDCGWHGFIRNGEIVNA